YYASNISAGANSVTVTFDRSAAYPDIRILEYRGVSTLDVAIGAAGSGNFADSGTVATTTAGDLLVGASTVAGLTSAAGANFTSRIITTPDGDIAEDRIAGAAGSYNATALLGGNAGWAMQMVAFKPSVSSGGPPLLTGVSPSSG